MFLEFPDDRTTHHLDRQYMLGPSLLIAPVFVPDGEESEYYIPEGVWTNLVHPDIKVTGPKWIREVVPIDEIPVWVRPGTVLCLGRDQVGRPDYEFNKELEIRLYEVNEGATNVPGASGNVVGSVKVKTVGDMKEITMKGDVDIETVTLVEGDGFVTKKAKDGGTGFIIRRG